MKMELTVLFGKYGMFYKELLCEGTLVTLNSMYICWKGYWIGFQAWGHNFESKTVGSFCVAVLLCILPW